MTEYMFSIEKDTSRTDVSGEKVYDMAKQSVEPKYE